MILVLVTSLLYFAESTPTNKGKFAFALDISSPLTLAGARCFKTNLYPAVFLRASSPYDAWPFANEICMSIRNAKRAGLAVEVFMTPDPFGNGTEQFDRLYSTLKNCGYNARSVWIQITSPINWPDTKKRNVDFIDTIIIKAEEYGVIVGIYTNHYDWKEITGGNVSLYRAKLLWYWNVPSVGSYGEDPSNFDNFRSFGPWKWPVAKQFGQVESICGYTANRNIYIPSRIQDKIGTGKDVSPYIGFIGLDIEISG